MSYDRSAIRKFYSDQLTGNFMRFWKKACDTEVGGVFTCFSNDGRTLLSSDKYVWSQGRFIWMLARYVSMIDRGILSDPDRDFYFEHALKTYRFVRDNAILPPGDGVCAYLTDCRGVKKAISGKGFYASYFEDCFVIMGFAELAKLAGDGKILEEALVLYDRSRAYFDRGDIVSEPYPQPDGFAVQANSMIMANVTSVLYEAAESLNHIRYSELLDEAVSFTRSILSFYTPEYGLLREHRALNELDRDTLFANYIAPGHAVESMWFCRNVIMKAGMGEDYMRMVQAVVKNSVKVGWDEKFGGLLRYTGLSGGKPEGRLVGHPQEDALLDTWDSKLWWPHSECLYATLLCYEDTGNAEFLELYEKVCEYTFKFFQNPDESVGEWIQILDRDGSPMEKVVALPVKDPYHIVRNFMLIVELMAQESGGQIC